MPTHATPPQTFVAPTMAEALAAAQSALGRDAVIIRTREVERSGIGRWLTGNEIEVTAVARPAVAEPSAPVVVHVSEPAPTPQPPTEPAEDLPKLVGLGTVAASEGESIADRLADIEAAVAALAEERAAATPLARRLDGCGLSAEMVDSVVREARRVVAQGAGELAALEAVLTDRIVVDVERPLAAGEQRRLALVGPTGVGKTTTLAKLAAAAVLDDGLNVGVISLDTHRVGAVEQVSEYARLLSVPVRAVENGEDARRAVGELAECDLVLIDTPGCGPADGERLRELRTGLSSVGADDIALCLSVGTSLTSNVAAAERFGSLRLTTLIGTKLDEAAEAGPLVDLCDRTALPLRLVTTGQDVPTDFEWAHGDRLARVVLGVEPLLELRGAA